MNRMYKKRVKRKNEGKAGEIKVIQGWVHTIYLCVATVLAHMSLEPMGRKSHEPENLNQCDIHVISGYIPSGFPRYPFINYIIVYY